MNLSKEKEVVKEREKERDGGVARGERWKSGEKREMEEGERTKKQEH